MKVKIRTPVVTDCVLHHAYFSLSSRLTVRANRFPPLFLAPSLGLENVLDTILVCTGFKQSWETTLNSQ